MRELKFRAWCKVDKKMLFDADPFALHVSGSNEPLLAKTHKNEDCIFEQYTGLKDKNGKEIYEGDIVLVANKGLTPYDVIYREGDCSFVANNEALMDYFHLFSDMSKCYDVIGNIHENSKLLEKK